MYCDSNSPQVHPCVNFFWRPLTKSSSLAVPLLCTTKYTPHYKLRLRTKNGYLIQNTGTYYKELHCATTSTKYYKTIPNTTKYDDNATASQRHETSTPVHRATLKMQNTLELWWSTVTATTMTCPLQPIRSKTQWDYRDQGTATGYWILATATANWLPQLQTGY